MPMRIAVATIPGEGRELPIDSTVDWAVAAAHTALEASPQSLSGTLRLSRENRTVHAQGNATAVAPRHCARCGEAFLLAVDATIDLTYMPESNPSDEVERELDLNELDVGWYREQHIDTGDILSEALALAMPTRLVCDATAACDARIAEQNPR